MPVHNPTLHRHSRECALMLKLEWVRTRSGLTAPRVTKTGRKSRYTRDKILRYRFFFRPLRVIPQTTMPAAVRMARSTSRGAGILCAAMVICFAKVCRFKAMPEEKPFSECQAKR